MKSLSKEEQKRIKKLEKDFKIKLEKVSYYKGVPCYHFKALKGNELLEIINEMKEKKHD